MLKVYANPGRGYRNNAAEAARRNTRRANNQLRAERGNPVGTSRGNNARRNG